MSRRREVTSLPAPTRKQPRCSKPGKAISSTQLQELSYLEKPEIPKSIRVTETKRSLPKTTFQQQGTSAFPNKQRSQSPTHNPRNRSMENHNQIKWAKLRHNQITNRVVIRRRLTKIKLTEFSGDSLEWPERAVLFDVFGHQKLLSDTEKMQYLKISFTGQAKTVLWNLRNYLQAVCRPRVIVESQLKELNSHPTVRHEDSTGNVRFAYIVTNTR